MTFLLSAEQRAFAASVRELLAKSDVPAVATDWAAGRPESGRALWARLAELGVTGLAIDEDHGGLAADPVDLVVAFEELGRAAVPGPLIESIAVLPTLLAGAELAADWLPKLAEGAALATLALPPHLPHALDADTAELCLLVDGGHLHTAETVGAPKESVDPTRRLVAVRAAEDLGAIDANRAFDTGVLACAAELLGAGHALLAAAVEHAGNRRQFGRPIGKFQAVKHQLANVLVGLELSRPLVYGAAIALREESATVARDVSAAKVACADAADAAARAALQVHGALGYTRECAVAAFLVRVRALRSAWGTAAFHRARVMKALV
jgi:alkylation response protein AidB-like acyl-CoA dehydrogenase